VKKKLSRKSKVLFVSISKTLTSISGIVSAIFLSRLLSIDEYATYRQTILVFSFLAPLMSLGFSRSMYYNFEKRKDNHAEQLLNIQYVILSIALLAALFFILGGAGLISKLFHNPLLEKTLIIYSIFTIFNVPLQLLQPILIIKEKVKLLTIFNIINRFITVFIIIFVAYKYKNAYSVVVAILFTGIISFVIAEIFMLINLPSINNFKINKSVIKDYTSVGIPLLVGTLIGMSGKYLDKFIISTLMTPKDLAIYANGAIEIPFIGAVTGAVMVIILADFTKLLKEKKIDEVFELWQKAVEYTSSLLIPIMFILLLNADWLIVAMFGKKYALSALPFKIYLLLLPMRTMTFTSLITASGKTKIIPIAAFIFLIINLILSLIFINYFGFIGPAIATVLASYLTGLYFSYKISKQHHIRIFKVFAITKIYLFLFIGLISYFIAKKTSIHSTNFSIIILENLIFLSSFILGIIIINKFSIYKDFFYTLILKNKNVK